ncbi:MAG: ATP synthase F1 subunit epsilon [Candidatus Liptonbacteria bacterium CG11_big_fil_rev_8_21_14_0_20_35_14]|uniref:ATP synthase F1 subunit epsilon n=1 Tax=Candidatus Liptonbacteria bacterium CG11_big_fil_rev_8_21_14_0_20_35_14 TaxID=1974634 RepID=A0A2H0N7J2_9BACT|nr:MAG: ATP synthase F1 subunit epsilon [Candidatus Liptonbacteria bacterium CG11_big_fil_rev_8_21_14_0_20_35_14]
MINFEVVSPERVILKENVKQVTIPTKEGNITIFPKHMALIALLKPGVITYHTPEGSIENLSIKGGFVEVLPTKVVVLADE